MSFIVSKIIINTYERHNGDPQVIPIASRQIFCTLDSASKEQIRGSNSVLLGEMVVVFVKETERFSVYSMFVDEL